MDLSLVIPVYNESESLESLHAELRQALDQLGRSSQIIFVDDGSTDRSWEEIELLAQADPTVSAIRLRRNFGKAAALQAGIEAADGTWIVTLDADGQDDPAEIPRFLEKADADAYDVVSGWKRVRHDPWHKVWPSRVFNLLVSRLTGVRLHDHNCGFKCYRRAVFDDVLLYGERHRFVPVLAASYGWRVGEIEVHHRPRTHGRSKYGASRFVKGFLDLLTVRFLTGFGQRPQHLFGTVGLLLVALGAVVLALLTLWWGISRIDNAQLAWQHATSDRAWDMARADDLHLHRRAAFYYGIVSVLLGTQLLSLGFLAELMAARYMAEHRPYKIRARIGAGSG